MRVCATPLCALPIRILPFICNICNRENKNKEKKKEINNLELLLKVVTGSLRVTELAFHL
jgi:hypothetical protein